MKTPCRIQAWLRNLYRHRLTALPVLSIVIIICLCVWAPQLHPLTVVNRYQAKEEIAMSETIQLDKKETSKSAEIIGNQVDVYAERSNRVLDICRRNISILHRGIDSNRILSNIRIIPRHRAVTCLIEKTASTYLSSIAQLMLHRPGRFESASPVMWSERLTRPNELKFVDNIWIMSNALKIMFVRNPYTRLLSGYEDKLLIPNTLFQQFGKNVIQFTRPNATKKARECGYDVTFPEFVKYVNYMVSKMLAPDMITGHFTPMFDHCGVCEINYDFIGKLENIRDDTQELLGRLNLKHLLPKKPHYIWEFEDQVGWMYSFKEDKNVQSCMSFTDIKYRYWKKFQIKGLIHRDMVMPDSVLHNDHITKKDMLTFLVKMGKRSRKMKDLKMNKIFALQEAYQNVALEDLREFQQLFKPDFDLFGYHIDDKDIFSKQANIDELVFFNVPPIIE